MGLEIKTTSQDAIVFLKSQNAPAPGELQEIFIPELSGKKLEVLRVPNSESCYSVWHAQFGHVQTSFSSTDLRLLKVESERSTIHDGDSGKILNEKLGKQSKIREQLLSYALEFGIEVSEQTSNLELIRTMQEAIVLESRDLQEFPELAGGIARLVERGYSGEEAIKLARHFLHTKVLNQPEEIRPDILEKFAHAPEEAFAEADLISLAFALHRDIEARRIDQQLAGLLFDRGASRTYSIDCLRTAHALLLKLPEEIVFAFTETTFDQFLALVQLDPAHAKALIAGAKLDLQAGQFDPKEFLSQIVFAQPGHTEEENAQLLAITKLLVSDDGRLPAPEERAVIVDAILLMLSESKDTGQLRQTVRILEKIRDDSDFCDLLESIVLPPEENREFAQMVRSTLGLDSKQPLTVSDVRRVCLSVLMKEVRQGSSGSCFGTSVAGLRVIQQPKSALRDLKSLCEHGFLFRKLNDQRVSIPLNPRTNLTSTHRYLSITQAKASPGMQNALRSLGLTETERERMLNDAFALLPPREHTPAKILAQIITFQAGRAFQEKVLSGDLVALSPTPLPHEIRFRDSKGIDQSITVFNRESFENALLRIRREIKIAGNDRLEELIMLESETQINFRRSQEDLQRLDHALDLYLGSTENRLSRAYEFTLATGAERHLQRSYAFQSSRALLTPKLGQKVVSIALGLERPGFSRREFGESVQKKFVELYSKRANFRYDPQLENIKVSEDGSSNRGGWVLHDESFRVDNARDYQEFIVRLYSEAVKMTCEEQKGEDGGQVDPGILSTFALQFRLDLTEHIMSNDFVDGVVSNLYTLFQQKPQDHTQAIRTPWKYESGAWAINILETLHAPESNGTEEWISLSDTTGAKTPFDGVKKWFENVFSSPRQLISRTTESGTIHVLDQLRNSLDEHLQTMTSRNRDYRVPITGNAHAFSVLPGHPTLRGFWGSGLTGTEFYEQNVKIPGKEFAMRALSQTAFDSIIATLGENDKTKEIDLSGIQIGTPREVFQQLRQALHGVDKSEELIRTAIFTAIVKDLPRIHLFDTNWEHGGREFHLTCAWDPIDNKAMLAKITEDGIYLGQDRGSTWFKDGTTVLLSNPSLFSED